MTNRREYSGRLRFRLAKILCLLASSALADEPVRITHVVLIGGFDSDPTPQQLAGTARRGVGNSGMFQLRGDLRAKKMSAEYFNWNGTPAGEINIEHPPGASTIVEHVRLHLARDPQARLAIVGNSMGGHTACDVCDRLDKADPPVKVQLAIFLDPSSIFAPDAKRPTALPANIVTGVQYASRTAVIWRPWPNEPRVLHIDLGDPQSGYLRPGGPAYNALFSANAHIGAEWDEMIHADICRRIVATTP